MPLWRKLENAAIFKIAIRGGFVGSNLTRGTTLSNA